VSTRRVNRDGCLGTVVAPPGGRHTPAGHVWVELLNGAVHAVPSADLTPVSEGAFQAGAVAFAVWTANARH
jgi:hypothetical protein